MTLSRRKFLAAGGAASVVSRSLLEGQAMPADLVLFNGKIVTVDDAFSIREAIVIKDGRIAAVGGRRVDRARPLFPG